MTQPTNDLRELVEELRQGAIHLFYGNRMRSAADTIEALIAERDAAVINFATLERAVVGSTGLSGIIIASDLRTRAEAAEARALAAEAREARMREALAWSMDEIDALSNRLCKWAYPQAMAFVDRRDQLDNYRKAVEARQGAQP